MSDLLKELSEKQANDITENAGNCSSWAAQLVISNSLCAMGFASSCTQAQGLQIMIDRNCR